MALKMGPEKLRQGLAEFGFGEKSGVDLPGEVRGLLRKLPGGDHQTANNSFGQGMAATALQVANAYAVLANGGVLKKPYIVERIRNLETGDETLKEAQEIRRVISPSQAESMRMMLTAVTQEKGTGASARVAGFQVAGKTGTAQKARVGGRGYEPGAYISSFAGLLPAHKPEFVIYVVVDHPRKAYYASQVAAPLFSKVASFAVRKAGLSPSLLADEDYQRSYQQQMTVAKTQNKNVKPVEVDMKIILQEEKAAAISPLPSLMNLSLRQALEKLQGQPVKIKAVGQGQVIGTFPREGELLQENETVTLFLQ
jgi:cell division protein FtsI (penicillin-binding protein 3)